MTNLEISRTIVPKIKEEMEKRKLGIRQLSDMSQVPYTSIWSILNNDGLPSLDTLLKLLDGLGIPISRFFADSEEDMVYKLSDNEIIVVEMMRKMNGGQREALINLVKLFR